MIPCNRCGVPVPQNRYSVTTDRMCADCKRELLEYKHNVPVDDLAADDEPERIVILPSNPSKRSEAMEFSLNVLAGALILGLALLVWLAF